MPRKKGPDPEIRAAIEAVSTPPAHLSERSQRLWRDLVPRRALSPARVALLQTALEALDRADMCRSVVTAENLVSVTERTGAMHVHPLLKVEKDARAQFASIWQTLSLVWEHSIDGAISGEEF